MACTASPLHAEGIHGLEDSMRFTEGELTDMLSFFDRHDAPVALDTPADALQAPQTVSRSDSDVPSGMPKQEQSGTSSPVATSTSNAALPSYCGLLPQMHRTLAGPGGAALLVANNGALFCAMPHQSLAAHDYAASMQQAPPLQTVKDSKLTVSHSTIEKQRRDRINSLIDELRELVPSAGTMKGPDGADMKRPKHVVLSDTISLLKHLRERAEQDQQQLQELKQLVHSGSATVAAAAAAAGTGAAAAAPAAPAEATATTTSAVSAQSLLQRSLSGPAQVQAATAASSAAVSGSAACPELPQAPINLPAAVGVLVEEGTGCFLVKVNCKDRRGLLSDITSAMKGLPLQITRAAITTSHGGAVYDVFEIVVEPEADLEGVTALDIQFQVHQALHKYKKSQMLQQQQQQQATSSSGEAAGNDAKRRRSE